MLTVSLTSLFPMSHARSLERMMLKPVLAVYSVRLERRQCIT